jgi:F0F1-type ATP synthase alpha subunit
VEAKYGSLLAQIAEKKQIDDAMRESLKNAINEFKERFKAAKAK